MHREVHSVHFDSRIVSSHSHIRRCFTSRRFRINFAVFLGFINVVVELFQGTPAWLLNSLDNEGREFIEIEFLSHRGRGKKFFDFLFVC